MRTFRDIESGLIVTEQQLREEYEVSKEDIKESSGATTFEEALQNCLNRNGFLEELK